LALRVGSLKSRYVLKKISKMGHTKKYWEISVPGPVWAD